MRRLKELLPTGTLLVGAGISLLGIAAYVQLAVAGHDLPELDMASLAVLWSIVFAVAPGLFLPLEQELTRLVADRHAIGNPIRPVLMKGVTLVGGAAALFMIIALLTQDQIARVLFNGDTSLVWIMCLSLAMHAAAHASRGALAGLGHFGWYGTQLAIDGGVRLVATALVAAFTSGEVALYAWMLVAAPALSVLLTLLPVIRSATPGEPLPWAALSGRLGMLTTSAFLNQLMINIAVINAKLISHGATAVSVALLSATIMARIPVFLFGAMHAALLAGAATAVARKDWDGLWQLVRRALLAVTAMVVATSLVLVPAGPLLAARLFNAPEVLTWVDFLLLSIGVVAYLWAFVFGQITVALNRHRAQALCWVAGTMVLVAVTLLPLHLSLRVELGFVCGALTTATLLGLTLRSGTRTRKRLEAMVQEVASR